MDYVQVGIQPKIQTLFD